MKILIIGGTGTISTAISRRLSESKHELYILNRGNTNNTLPSNIKFIKADINDEKAASEALGDMKFDVVCDFIGFVQPQLERDFRLFAGKTKQFVYISSSLRLQQTAFRLYHYRGHNLGKSLLGVFEKQNTVRGVPDEAVQRRGLPRYDSETQSHLLRNLCALGNSRTKRKLAGGKTYA